MVLLESEWQMARGFRKITPIFFLCLRDNLSRIGNLKFWRENSPSLLTSVAFRGFHSTLRNFLNDKKYTHTTHQVLLKMVSIVRSAVTLALLAAPAGKIINMFNFSGN